MDKQVNRDTQFSFESVEASELTGVSGGLGVVPGRETLPGFRSGERDFQSTFGRYVLGRNLPVPE